NRKRQRMNKTRSLQVPRNPLARLQEMEAEASPAVTQRPTAAGELKAEGGTHARTNAPTHARTNEPVETAAWSQLLATPLPEGFMSGPFQAGTVRMAVEVWKRLGWIASFTGRAKQDIIGEALLAYIERIKNETH